MTTPVYDFAVIGGGIVGLSTALHAGLRFPWARVLVLEKEPSPALHQTGRNSGVIHSGIYYKPRSYKARFAHAGARSMREFCQQHHIPHEICGKVIVATCEAELPLLENLYDRARQNDVPVERASAERIREIEPHVRCLSGIRIESTGITDYRQVSRKYLELMTARGASAVFGAAVTGILDRGGARILRTSQGDFEARFVINCAGLHSDRVARSAGAEPGARIVPFRGEYFQLVPERRHLVKTLIYPVPNPSFPFLGVHFTRMVDGSIHAGPNAVLALAREGYSKLKVNLRDLGETLGYGGFWRLASAHLGEGMKEMWRSVSKPAFTRSLQRLIPEVRSSDLVPCESGIRAQALTPEGKLVDDFLIVPGRNAIHVCNAPSPAATASLEIGRHIAAELPESRPAVPVGPGGWRPAPSPQGSIPAPELADCQEP